jgi:hypothetical protein
MAGKGRFSMGKFVLCSTVMVGLVWYLVQMFDDVYNAPATAMEHRAIQMHLQEAAGPQFTAEISQAPSEQNVTVLCWSLPAQV